MGRSSPYQQGREQDRMFVGIDVSKDRLDVHVRPSSEVFAVARDSDGLEELVIWLRTLAPQLIVVEATGGYETVVASAIGAAGPARRGQSAPDPCFRYGLRAVGEDGSA
jgi:hypothetical protein